MIWNRKIRLVVTLICVITIFSCEQKKMERPDDEKLIWEVRQRSNQAIAKKDTVALGNAWTDDYHIITSRNAEASGRAANITRFAAEFKSKPDVIYIRTPTALEVFAAWKMASETGTWVGRWTDNGARIELQGTYYAKWHKINGEWLIRAEIFTPLSCSGGEFCDKSPI
jgi:ketosteroid isomerase-like protein